MANISYCKNCGSKIDGYAYFNALFCSGRCRTQFCRKKAFLKPKISDKTLQISNQDFQEPKTLREVEIVKNGA